MKGTIKTLKVVLFDMFETLITHYQSPLYFGKHMAADAGIPEHTFQSFWEPTEYDRTIGKLTLENALEGILRENGCYSEELINKHIKKEKKLNDNALYIFIQRLFPC